jgi:hypothetical protein
MVTVTGTTQLATRQQRVTTTRTAVTICTQNKTAIKKNPYMIYQLQK